MVKEFVFPVNLDSTLFRAATDATFLRVVLFTTILALAASISLATSISNNVQLPIVVTTSFSLRAALAANAAHLSPLFASAAIRVFGEVVE